VQTNRGSIKMITQKHLVHWLTEIQYQLNGITSEIDPQKVVLKLINVGNTGESVVSFEYLNEKKDTIRQMINNIIYDMEHDETDYKVRFTKIKIFLDWLFPRMMYHPFYEKWRKENS